MLSPYDCEEDMLLLKAAVMGPHARAFVVGEAERSNSNQPRAPCFNATAFSALFHDPSFSLVYLPIPGGVQDFKYWEQEVYVKNRLASGLLSLRDLADDALVIMFDMDEFISGEHVRMLRWYDHPRGLTAFRVSLRWSYYGFEWVNPEPTEVGAIVSWAQLRGECGMRSNDIRFNMCGLSSGVVDLLPMVGWHCSWCFPDTRQFIAKIEKSSKLEDNQARFKDLAFLADQRARGLWFVDSQPHGCFDANATSVVA